MMEENAIGAWEELTSKAVMVFLEQGYPTGPSSARDITKGIIDRILADVPLLLAAVGAVEIPWCDVHDHDSRLQDGEQVLCDFAWGIQNLGPWNAAILPCRREDPPTHWRVT